MPSGNRTIPQRRSSRSQTRTTLPESVAEAQRVDTALRRHNLVPYEPPHGIGDHWNCFFHAWLDAWALTRFPPLHQDVTDVSELARLSSNDSVEIIITSSITGPLMPGCRNTLTLRPQLSNLTPKICHARRMEKFLQWLRTYRFPATGHAGTHG
jgi:hypothetical protein